jgi:hypothetical protein
MDGKSELLHIFLAIYFQHNDTHNITIRIRIIHQKNPKRPRMETIRPCKQGMTQQADNLPTWERKSSHPRDSLRRAYCNREQSRGYMTPLHWALSVMPKQVKYSASFIIQMFQKQKGRCIYCNHSLIVGDKYRKPTIEHITPKSQGWTDSQDNLCLACFKCNMYRGNIDLDLFMDGYRCWCEHSGNDSNSITLPRKFRSPKRWYHGNLIKW